MFLFVLLVFTLLASYGFAYQQVIRDVPYMFIERNILLGFVVNCVVLFFFCVSGQIGYMRILDVATVYVASLVVPALMFYVNYSLLKPTAHLLRKYG